MPENLIACRIASYGKFRARAFEHMAEVGLRYAEVDKCPESEWDALQGNLEKNGLTASSVGGSVDLSNFESIAGFDLHVRLAQRLGSKIIFLSVKTGGIPFDEACAKLRGLGDVAQSHGTTIALETHPDMVTNGEVATKTMLGTKHEHVKLNYDSANLYYYNEGVDGIDELKQFIPHLGAVHLKETNGKLKTWYFPGLHEGEGIVDFPEIFRLCHEANFYGPYTMEIEGIKDENLSEQGALDRIKNSVEYLKSIGQM